MQDRDVSLLRALSASYPTISSALAEAAGLRASLTLPARTIHIISDIHGEHAKLRHVINNASGALRPAVAALLNNSLTDVEQRELLSVIYYPGEVLASLRPGLIESGRRRDWVRQTLHRQFELIRQLSKPWRRDDLNQLLPAEFAELFKELIAEPLSLRPPGYYEMMLGAFEKYDRDFAAVRAASRLIRNLSAAEILVAGDLGDRGPRIDKVIDILQQQPNVSIVWGNHDAHWLGACLGHAACIASVVRFSLRYRRLAQLEEGYGIVLTELENLANSVYGSDPATQFAVKGEGIRDAQLLARMQKAITVILLKLEGQIISRHPEWNLAHRDLLPRIDLRAGTIGLDGKVHPLLDAHLPTIDPAHPNHLSPEEQACIESLQASFIASPRLWEHMSWMVTNGCMWTVRDDLLILHACVPVDDQGAPLPLDVEGKQLSGRDLMDELTLIVRRAFRHGAADPNAERAGDWLWYLWCGPRSPLFGKDKIATFESTFLADPAAKEEHKNPYFSMLNDPAFVIRIGKLFDCSDQVLLVNGHVPVKIEKGELPVKKGGNAVTIDGAFSEAYGDHGYSLLLASNGVSLAEHAHFDSIDAVISRGKDIVPTVTTIRTYTPPRKVSDTNQGQLSKQKLHELEKLIVAYEEGFKP